jgi:hypothetical protein
MSLWKCLPRWRPRLDWEMAESRQQGLTIMRAALQYE